MKPVYALNSVDQRLYQMSEAGFEELGTTVRFTAPSPVLDSVWFQLRGVLWCAMRTAETIDIARLDGVNLKIARTEAAPTLDALWGDALVFGGEALWIERREDGSAVLRAFDGTTLSSVPVLTEAGQNAFLPGLLTPVDRMPLIVAGNGLAIGARAVADTFWPAPVRLLRNGTVLGGIRMPVTVHVAPDQVADRFAVATLNEFRVGKFSYAVTAAGRLTVRDLTNNTVVAQKRLAGTEPMPVTTIEDGVLGAEVIVPQLTNDLFETYFGWEFTPTSGAAAGEAFMVVSDQYGRLSLRNKRGEALPVQSRNIRFVAVPPLLGACEMFELAGGVAGVVVGRRVSVAFFTDGRQVRSAKLAIRGSDASIFADAESSRIFVSVPDQLVAVDALSLLETPVSSVPGVFSGIAYSTADLSVSLGTPLVDPVSRRIALQGEVFGDGPVTLSLEFNVGQGWQRSKTAPVLAVASAEGTEFTLIHTVDRDAPGYVGDFTYRVQATRQGT